ncbi:Uncharacterised protein [Mycobacteroides abscessus subsp. massiliense]|nr:Uncharacterised protein [Mycobacteroides abscessus subsp. massiliense]
MCCRSATRRASTPHRPCRPCWKSCRTSPCSSPRTAAPATPPCPPWWAGTWNSRRYGAPWASRPTWQINGPSTHPPGRTCPCPSTTSPAPAPCCTWRAAVAVVEAAAVTAAGTSPARVAAAVPGTRYGWSAASTSRCPSLRSRCSPSVWVHPQVLAANPAARRPTASRATTSCSATAPTTAKFCAALVADWGAWPMAASTTATRWATAPAILGSPRACSRAGRTPRPALR